MPMENEVQQTTPADSYFGSRVRNFRKAVGWTQEELAQALADRFSVVLHQTTVAKLESGSRPTNVLEIVALASVLGVSYDDLLPPPDHVPHPSEYVQAVKTAFLQAQAMASAAQREVDMATDSMHRARAVAVRAVVDATALEARYHATLKADESYQRAMHEPADDTEGEVD